MAEKGERATSSGYMEMSAVAKEGMECPQYAVDAQPRLSAKRDSLAGRSSLGSDGGPAEPDQTLARQGEEIVANGRSNSLPGKVECKCEEILLPVNRREKCSDREKNRKKVRRRSSLIRMRDLLFGKNKTTSVTDIPRISEKSKVYNRVPRSDPAMRAAGSVPKHRFSVIPSIPVIHLSPPENNEKQRCHSASEVTLAQHQGFVEFENLEQKVQRAGFRYSSEIPSSSEFGSSYLNMSVGRTTPTLSASSETSNGLASRPWLHPGVGGGRISPSVLHPECPGGRSRSDSLSSRTRECSSSSSQDSSTDQSMRMRACSLGGADRPSWMSQHNHRSRQRSSVHNGRSSPSWLNTDDFIPNPNANRRSSSVFYVNDVDAQLECLRKLRLSDDDKGSSTKDEYVDMGENKRLSLMYENFTPEVIDSELIEREREMAKSSSTAPVSTCKEWERYRDTLQDTYLCLPVAGVTTPSR